MKEEEVSFSECPPKQISLSLDPGDTPPGLLSFLLYKGETELPVFSDHPGSLNSYTVEPAACPGCSHTRPPPLMQEFTPKLRIFQKPHWGTSQLNVSYDGIENLKWKTFTKHKGAHFRMDNLRLRIYAEGSWP